MILRTRQRERRKLSRAIATSTPLTYFAHSKNRLYPHPGPLCQNLQHLRFEMRCGPSNDVRILSYHRSDVVSTCDRNLLPRLEWRESLVRTCVTPESISSIAATARGLGVP